MAWLQATPKPDTRSRNGQNRADDQQAPKLSRIEQLKRNRIPAQMPPNPAPHITDRLIEMGVSEAAGMGVVPLSWLTISQWCSLTNVDLQPWEARLIRRLSSTYLAESRLAENEHCPPPWRGVVTQREREIEEAQLRAVLG
jgi:hypothetical protein